MILFDFNNGIPSNLADFSNDEHLAHAISFIDRWNQGDTTFTFKSSGSTGIPKEITLSKDFLLESAQRTIHLFDINSSDTLLLALNTSFMGGLMMIVRAILAKCHVIYISPPSVSTEILKTLPPIKLASFVPVQLKKVLVKEDDAFKQIQYVLVGGSPVDECLQQTIINMKSLCTFYHTYGMTETASHVAIRNISQQEPYYHALPGYTFSTDIKNCLTIYYSPSPSFTIQTNDIVNLYSPQHFEWIGRADWVVNSGGIKFNIETAEETIAHFFNQQNNNILFTSQKIVDEQWGERWVLIIQSIPLSEEQEHALRLYCKKHLGEYIYPKEIRYTKKMVYLPSGKIDRFNTFKETF